jgi:hypothetical protein
VHLAREVGDRRRKHPAEGGEVLSNDMAFDALLAPDRLNCESDTRRAMEVVAGVLRRRAELVVSSRDEESTEQARRRITRYR